MPPNADKSKMESEPMMAAWWSVVANVPTITPKPVAANEVASVKMKIPIMLLPKTNAGKPIVGNRYLPTANISKN